MTGVQKKYWRSSIVSIKVFEIRWITHVLLLMDCEFKYRSLDWRVTREAVIPNRLLYLRYSDVNIFSAHIPVTRYYFWPSFAFNQNYLILGSSRKASLSRRTQYFFFFIWMIKFRLLFYYLICVITTGTNVTRNFITWLWTSIRLGVSVHVTWKFKTDQGTRSLFFLFIIKKWNNEIQRNNE